MSDSPSLRGFHREQRSSNRPIWREAFVGLDWVALHSSPIYYGLGVPKGDKSAVILVPGFMGTDLYLHELHYWFKRVGYRPYRSGIGWNAECINTLVGRLSDTVLKANRETGRRVHLIGHSLGGILARATTALNPDPIASVTTLGSPFRGIQSHPLVLAAAKGVRSRIRRLGGKYEPGCYTGYCGCNSVEVLQQELPAHVTQTAIYTKTDGIVDWRVCLSDVPERNVEVTGTHVGLAFNAAVYKVLVHRLKQAHGSAVFEI
ncbi:MAG TPA: alpha/beta fold hydrolase [Blastocatellia bacterium]|nr:alpha/beta fold hydrolase [Blastocatellia bacterium]